MIPIVSTHRRPGLLPVIGLIAFWLFLVIIRNELLEVWSIGWWACVVSGGFTMFYAGQRYLAWKLSRLS